MAWWLWYLLSAGLVLFAAGLAWDRWWGAGGRDGAERLADALGVSLAASACLGLAAFGLGLRFDAPLLAGGYGALLALALAGWLWRGRRAGWRNGWCGWVGGLLALGGLSAWRLYQSAGLALPAWVDSVHHVLIVARLMALGGLPVDLMPEMPVPFFYHYGFHLAAARFGQLTLLPAEQAVLVMGQVLNAAVSLAIYRLGRALGQTPGRAAAAGLLAGFALQMPAFYLAWGRYTLLTGLVLLPLAMAAALEAAQWPGRGEPRARLALLAAGVCLSHYLAAGLLALFVALLLAGGVWRRQGGAWTPALAALGGALLASPWLGRAWWYTQRYAGVQFVSPGEPAAGTYAGYLLALSGPWRNQVLLLLALAGLVWAWRQSGRRVFAAWATLLFALALPWGLRLDPFRPDHLAIVLFLPAALLVSDLLAAGGEALGRCGRRTGGRVVYALALGGLLLWGLVETRTLVGPATLLADAADLAAVQWVRTHTPPEARFLINTTLWQTASYRGVDGGYWLLPLTGRQTLLPPAIYGYGERAYIRQVNDRAQRASRLRSCDGAFWDLVREAGVTHIYVHVGRGRLQPAGLNGCDGIQKVYDSKDVVIYLIR